MRFPFSPSTIVTAILACTFICGCSKQPAEPPQSSAQNQDSESISRADQLAAHPADPSKPKNVAGVSDEQLQSGDGIEKAATACMDAVEKNPDEPRCHFELGRVLVLAGLVDEGREQLEAAASKGHGGAFFYLAQLEDDLGEVSDLLQKSSSAGFKPADDMLAQLTASEPLSQTNNAPSKGDSEQNGFPLRDQTIADLKWSMLGPIADVPIDIRDSVTVQVEQLIHSGQKVLICSYGVSETEKTTYYFWYQTVPANLATLVNGIEKHPLRRLGFKPCTNAPANSEEARRTHESQSKGGA
jgi:hypothetical protein